MRRTIGIPLVTLAVGRVESGTSGQAVRLGVVEVAATDEAPGPDRGGLGEMRRLTYPGARLGPARSGERSFANIPRDRGHGGLR